MWAQLHLPLFHLLSLLKAQARKWEVAETEKLHRLTQALVSCAWGGAAEFMSQPSPLSPGMLGMAA